MVYILSDGDLNYNEHREQMQKHLTQANDARFRDTHARHGRREAADAQFNLRRSPSANRGTFQMVRPLPAAVQLAKLRPIRSNERGVAWGTGFQQSAR